jgi:hypothetical protein
LLAAMLNEMEESLKPSEFRSRVRASQSIFEVREVRSVGSRRIPQGTIGHT